MSQRSPYFLIEGVPLNDVVQAKDLEVNIQHYKQLLNSWFINPAKKLAASSTKDDRMAAFVLLLTFFEPHGDCLSSKGGSGDKFKNGLGSFLGYLDDNKIRFSEKIDRNSLKDHLWKNARCGIFHALTPEGVTIDLYDIFSDIFTVYNTKFIVNVKHMGAHMADYIDYYFSHLNDDRKNNFKSHYHKLVIDPAMNLITSYKSKR